MSTTHHQREWRNKLNPLSPQQQIDIDRKRAMKDTPLTDMILGIKPDDAQLIDDAANALASMADGDEVTDTHEMAERLTYLAMKIREEKQATDAMARAAEQIHLHADNLQAIITLQDMSYAEPRAIERIDAIKQTCERIYPKNVS